MQEWYVRRVCVIVGHGCTQPNNPVGWVASWISIAYTTTIPWRRSTTFQTSILSSNLNTTPMQFILFTRNGLIAKQLKLQRNSPLLWIQDAIENLKNNECSGIDKWVAV
jgi:hypothetical protein